MVPLPSFPIKASLQADFLFCTDTLLKFAHGYASAKLVDRTGFEPPTFYFLKREPLRENFCRFSFIMLIAYSMLLLNKIWN